MPISIRIVPIALALACSWPIVATASDPNAAPAVRAERVRHVSLFTPDNARLARWYVEMLGMREDARFTLTRPDGQRIDVIRLRLGDFLMHVSQLAPLEAKARDREYAGWRHIALVVPDVDVAWTALRARGADVVGKGGITFDPPGYRVSFVRDPDGNFVELYQDRAR